MCTKEEVKEEIQSALSKNNIVRDKLWEERNLILLGHMENSIDRKLGNIKITPETKDSLNSIQRVCDVRGVQIKNMEDKIDKVIIKIDDLIEKLDSKFADKDDFIFWRNILIIGIILSTFTGVFAILLRS